MRKIGIITIHKIYNYGSVLQAYALQRICEIFNFDVSIIDYKFPNEYHNVSENVEPDTHLSVKETIIKYLFSFAFIRQRVGFKKFVKKYLNLTNKEYQSPEDLRANAPLFDIYMTGSDQVWSQSHCKGDPAFLLHFAPLKSKRISYSASFGSSVFNPKYEDVFRNYLSQYDSISVREQPGVDIVKNLCNQTAQVVLDPTLLLGLDEWNKILPSKRLLKEKYVVCYFLNYSFNAFPYVEILTDYIYKITGLKIVWIARPPKRFINPHIDFYIGASPLDFLSLIRDAELVLTTSFHGTVFAANFCVPMYSIVESFSSNDSRVSSFLKSIGLYDRLLSLDSDFPLKEDLFNVSNDYKEKLSELREESLCFLRNSLN